MALIRVAEPGDAQGICDIYAPIVRETAISFEVVPPGVKELAERIQRAGAEFPWLVCERVDGLLAGYAYAARHRQRAAYQWGVDVTVYVHPRARRSGVARALYASLFAILRRQGFFNAYAVITLPNEASVALHQSLGFQAIGVHHFTGYKLGKWHDVSWWELALQPRVDEPAAPIPFREINTAATYILAPK